MRMKLVVPALALALAAGTVAAVVGGGDITQTTPLGKVTFSHQLHVEKKGLQCTECHPKLYTSVAQHKPVTMQAMQKGESCGACHDGKRSFSVMGGECAKCHITQ